MRRFHLAIIAALAASGSAVAETVIVPIATPKEPGVIYLYDNRKTESEEQWEKRGPTRIVRNVVSPTLRLFLPPPSKATGAAIIVAPGGGYQFLQIDEEGYQAARWLADHGVATFVLKYRLQPTPREPAAFAAALKHTITQLLQRDRRTWPPSGRTLPFRWAVEDGQQALHVVRARANEFRIDPHRVGFLGFSAGAGVAVQLALAPVPATRPNFVASIYGPLNPVTVPADAPPMFSAIAADDPVMDTAGFGLIKTWIAAGRPVEFHLYNHGGHGFGMQKKRATSDLWIDQFYKWMEYGGLLARP